MLDVFFPCVWVGGGGQVQSKMLVVASTDNKIRENRLRWIGYVQQRLISDRSNRIMIIEATRTKAMPKRTWIDAIKGYDGYYNLTKEMTPYGAERRKIDSFSQSQDL